jgi:hypothetical protein
MAILAILWLFGTFFDNIWYIFSVLVCFTEKNLATLIAKCILRRYTNAPFAKAECRILLTCLDSISQVWIPFYKFGFHFTSLDSILQVWIPFTSLDSILQVWIPFYKFGFHFTSLDSILQVWIQFCKFGFNFQWFNYIKNFRHSWFKIISSFVPIGLVDRDTFRVKSFPNGKLSINSELIIYKLSVKILFSIFGF